MPEQAEIVAQLQDFRQRVLQAEKLSAAGEQAQADALLPSREEMIQAVKAYRQSLGRSAPKRAATAASKAKANEIAQMDNLADLFKK